MSLVNKSSWLSIGGINGFLPVMMGTVATHAIHNPQAVAMTEWEIVTKLAPASGISFMVGWLLLICADCNEKWMAVM